MKAKLRVGLYGTNGHQITGSFVDHPDAELAAVAGFGGRDLGPGAEGVPVYGTLEQMLDAGDLDLVSLCSPRRADQARDAIQCLEAGLHVYAEKPCALTEPDLDAILAAVKATGRRFHEMAGTVVQQPYMEMRRLVREGAVGDVVQVFVQKCYPWYDGRPADEELDGGLVMQVGIYPMRFVEHIAGERIASLDVVETKRGNPVVGSECRMAVSMAMALESGAVASAVCNYLNPMKETCWGYEILRVFGTRGIVESSMEGPRARLILTGEVPRDLDVSARTLDYFDLFAASLRSGSAMPLTVEQELACTRWAIRARETVRGRALVR